MTDIERIQSPLTWQDRVLATWQDRTLTKEVRETLIREQLAGAKLALRLSNMYKLTQMQLEMHIELGERIATEMSQASTPVRRLALEMLWENWIKHSNAVVRSIVAQ